LLYAIDDEKDAVVDGKVITMNSLDLFFRQKTNNTYLFNVIFHASSYMFFIFTALSSNVFYMDALSTN